MAYREAVVCCLLRLMCWVWVRNHLKASMGVQLADEAMEDTGLDEALTSHGIVNAEAVQRDSKAAAASEKVLLRAEREMVAVLILRAGMSVGWLADLRLEFTPFSPYHPVPIIYTLAKRMPTPGVSTLSRARRQRTLTPF